MSSCIDPAARLQHSMQSFLVSASVVGLTEIGDKTQLLSLVLAARYRKPISIMLGVFVATLINHACSGALGAWLADVIRPEIMNWAVVASFGVMAVWIPVARNAGVPLWGRRSINGIGCLAAPA